MNHFSQYPHILFFFHSNGRIVPSSESWKSGTHSSAVVMSAWVLCQRGCLQIAWNWSASLLSRNWERPWVDHHEAESHSPPWFSPSSSPAQRRSERRRSITALTLASLVSSATLAGRAEGFCFRTIIAELLSSLGEIGGVGGVGEGLVFSPGFFCVEGGVLSGVRAGSTETGSSAFSRTVFLMTALFVLGSAGDGTSGECTVIVGTDLAADTWTPPETVIAGE